MFGENDSVSLPDTTTKTSMRGLIEPRLFGEAKGLEHVIKVLDLAWNNDET